MKPTLGSGSTPSSSFHSQLPGPAGQPHSPLSPLRLSLEKINQHWQAGYRPDGRLISEAVEKLQGTTGQVVQKGIDLQISLQDAHLSPNTKMHDMHELLQLEKQVQAAGNQLRGELVSLLQGKSTEPVSGFDAYRSTINTASTRFSELEQKLTGHPQDPMPHDQHGPDGHGHSGDFLDMR